MAFPNLLHLFTKRTIAPEVVQTDDLTTDMARYDALMELGYFDDDNDLTTEQRERIAEELDEKFEELRDPPENAGRSAEDLYLAAGRELAQKQERGEVPVSPEIATQWRVTDRPGSQQIALEKLIHDNDVSGPLGLYVYNSYGFHTGATWFGPETATARQRAEKAISQGLEVRITNGADNLVFHAVDGKVIYPENVETFWQRAAQERTHTRSLAR